MVKLLILVLQTARWIKDYLEKRGQLEAAQEQILRELEKISNGLVKKANVARTRVKHDTDSVRKDEFNRD